MLGWLKTKAQNSRVYMVTKELKWELESSDPVRSAKILAMANVFRVQLFNDDEMPADIFDRPLDYSRDELMGFYDTLEEIRNAQARQMEHLKKVFSRLGGAFPEFAQDQVRISNRALEVWMVTLGAGIVPDQRDQVREIWQRLLSFKSRIDEAMAGLVETERQTLQMTGSDESETMYQALDRTQWKDWCEYVPSQLSKGINKS